MNFSLRIIGDFLSAHSNLNKSVFSILNQKGIATKYIFSLNFISLDIFLKPECQYVYS